MPHRKPHAGNCPAVWRGFYLTLRDRIPEDAPCVCGAEVLHAAPSDEVTARAA